MAISVEVMMKRLKNMPQYRKLPEEEIRKLAEEKTFTPKDLDVSGLFGQKEEKRTAKSLLYKYLQDFKLENISDKNLLLQLIYLEVYQIRLQKNAEEFQKSNGSAPLQILDAIHKNLAQIVNLKEKLGLTKEVKTEQDNFFEQLKRKMKVWLSENQGSRTLTCGWCGKMLLLKIKTDIWESQKHPFFKDRILGNDHLIKLYKENKLTKEDLSKIFQTSLDYIDWLVEKWGQIPEEINDRKN